MKPSAKDKNGNNLHSGDWVLYPYYNHERKIVEYFYDPIKIIDFVRSPLAPYTVSSVLYIPNFNHALLSGHVEKLPANSEERKLVVFLKSWNTD